MKITAAWQPTIKKWQVTLNLDGYIITKTDVRIGCALRNLLNQLEYDQGKPAGDLDITIEGW